MAVDEAHRLRVVKIEQPAMERRGMVPATEAAADRPSLGSEVSGNRVIPHNTVGLPQADQENVCMTSTRAVSPAAGWTHKLDPEEKQEHEFSNLLQEFLYAVQRQDGMMTEYCACELKRMFRQRRPQKKDLRLGSNPARKRMGRTCVSGRAVGCDSRADPILRI